MPPAEDLTNLLLDGRYRLTRLMGEGGMGQVYEGYHETLDRKVAVKVLLPRFAYEPKFRERFLREAKAASKVRHPNVVQILDFGDTPGGSVYFAMEFLEGRDLQTLLRQEGRLAWPKARPLLLQIVSALAAAHESRIIHRDLKPANFFITEARGRQDLVKVLDFGIAKLAAATGPEESALAQSLTGTGEVFGTAKYMAPEQAYGASDDPRVDIYSLGIVAYEMLTGQVPFTGVSVFDIVTRHVNEPPRPPRELVPDIPPAVEAIILRAIAKRPEDRFASMEVMEQALLEAPAGPGVPVTLPVVPSHPLPPSASGSWPSGAAAWGTSGPARVAAPERPPMPPSGVEASAEPTRSPGSRPQKRTVLGLPPRSSMAAPVPSVTTVVAPMPLPVPVQPVAPLQPPTLLLPQVAPVAPAFDPSASSSHHGDHGHHGHGTSVIPTRLKAPSPVTSGELMASPVAPQAEVPIASGPEDSESYGATSPLQGSGDIGSGTGPEDPWSVNRRVNETDPHAVFPRPAAEPSRGLVLGLLGTLGGGAVVFAGFFLLSSSEEPPAAPSEPVPVESVPMELKPVEPEPAIAKAGAPTVAVESPAPGPETATTATSPDAGAVQTAPAGSTTPSAPVEPKPAKPPASTGKPTKPASTGKPKPPAPLTDAKVESQLARALKKKCSALARGTKVTVNVVVAADGHVLSKSARGATGDLQKCLFAGVEKAAFPAGKTRTVPIEVSL
jgi:serine/threonine protein kinase